MMILAIKDYEEMMGRAGVIQLRSSTSAASSAIDAARERQYWATVRANLVASVRKHLWPKGAAFPLAHYYTGSEGSPFRQDDFNEKEVRHHVDVAHRMHTNDPSSIHTGPSHWPEQ